MLRKDEELPLHGQMLPVSANKDDLKLLACLLDFPVGLHQHSGEASTGRTLKDKSRTPWHDITSLLPAAHHQGPSEQDPSRTVQSNPVCKRDGVSSPLPGKHPAQAPQPIMCASWQKLKQLLKDP
jgi:hypothetical protein